MDQEPRYWIGVAARSDVMKAVEGGFCQFGHGRAGPLQRLAPGDAITFYAPRERLRAGPRVQAFVAIGRVKEGAPYRAEEAGGFRPWRRDVDYLDAAEYPIRPLLPDLGFVPAGRTWALVFRRSLFEIPRKDFNIIAGMMGVRRAFR